MTTAITHPKTPMEEFQDNLKKALRDDIARMLPDAAVADMIKRVMEEGFFKKRKVPKPGRSTYSDETIEKSTWFQEMIIEAAQPILEREAAKLVEKLEYQIADSIKATIEEGVVQVTMRVLTHTINASFYDAESRFKQSVVDMLKRNGLTLNAY